MSDDRYAEQVARQIADLRLQVNALEVAAKNGSLPEMLRQTRRTILWSALFVGIALVASSFIRAQGEDAKVRSLEQRVEQLEHDRTGK